MNRVIFIGAVLALVVHAVGQISTDEAYQRLKQRQSTASTRAVANSTTQSSKPVTLTEAIREATRELNQTLNMKVQSGLTEVQADELRQKIKNRQASIVKELAGKRYPMQFTVTDVSDATKHDGMGLDGLPFISPTHFALPQPLAQEVAWNDYLREIRRYASHATALERPAAQYRLEQAERDVPRPIAYVVVSGSSEMKSWRRSEVKNLDLIIDHVEYKTMKDWFGKEDGDRSWQYVSELDVFAELESDYIAHHSQH